MPEGKAKLTLSVDSEVVQAAHDLGINISELTEQALRSFTYKPEDLDEQALATQRQALFESMVPLLKRYGVRVQVGTYSGGQMDDETAEWGGQVYLSSRGNFALEVPEDEAEYQAFPFPESITAADVDRGKVDHTPCEVTFLPTDKILRNFMKLIQDTKAERRQRVESLAVARRIVEAITQVDDAETAALTKKRPKGENK